MSCGPKKVLGRKNWDVRASISPGKKLGLEVLEYGDVRRGTYMLRGPSKTPSFLTSTYGIHMKYTYDLRMKPDPSSNRAGTWLEQDERLLVGCWSTCFSPDGDEGGNARRARRAEAIAVRVARTKHVPGR